MSNVQFKILEGVSLPDQFSFLSSPYDAFLWLESPALDDLIASLATEIDALSDRKKRDRRTSEKFTFAIKSIVLNLLNLNRTNPNILLSIPKSSSAFTCRSRYGQKQLAYKPFIDAYDGLMQLDYIGVAKRGFWNKDQGRGEVTRIKINDKLLSLVNEAVPQDTVIFIRYPGEECIHLKDKDKKLVDYVDTKYTQQSRADLNVINKCLNRHWYDLDMPDADFQRMYQRIRSKHDLGIDNQRPFVGFSSRSMYRVFNNGKCGRSKNNFTEGGRFYGGWWQSIPSEYRKCITIDGKWTVELDYSNLHPHMVYAEAGLQLDSDAYQIEGCLDRDMAKLAFNALLNANGKIKKPDGYNDAAVGMGWNELLDAIVKRHEPIKDYFRTGYGLKLMFTDSEIASRIMLYYANKDIPCLSVHDSFIMHYGYEDELQEQMVKQYRVVTGHDITIKSDDGYGWMVRRYKERTVSDTGFVEADIMDLLNDNSQTARRWMSWLEQNEKKPSRQ